MTARVLIPLAEGFEEIEAVALIDVLRRGGLEVTTAGLEGAGAVEGAHGIAVSADAALADLDAGAFDAIVLPGGLPGTLRLMEDQRLLAALRAHAGAGKCTAAICAAPMVLARAGLVDGRAVTSHPSVRDRLGAADVRAAPRVVRDGVFVTSQGPGTAIELGLELVGELVGRGRADELAAAMLVQRG